VTSYQTPVQSPAPLVTKEDITTALALLDRIDRIAVNARKSPDDDVRKLAPVGTSGSSSATAMFKIDAADLDEIHAEVEQIRRLLKTQ